MLCTHLSECFSQLGYAFGVKFAKFYFEFLHVERLLPQESFPEKIWSDSKVL